MASIPAGARKISITEEGSSDNFLALKDNSSHLILNSLSTQEPSKSFIGA